MKIIIDIPSEMLEDAKADMLLDIELPHITNAIANGIPLDDIKTEIDEFSEMHMDGEFYIKNIDVKRILNKHMERRINMNDKQSKTKDLLNAIRAYEALETIDNIAFYQDILFDGDEEKNKQLEDLCKEALLSVYDLVAKYVNV